MELNNQIPGLPEWPPIRFDKERMECVVGGKHLSYASYDRGRKMQVVFLFGAILVSILLGYTVSLGLGTLLTVLCFVIMGVLSWFPLMKFIFERTSSVDTHVRFTPEAIFIDGKRYAAASNTSVQFRAQRTPLTDKELSRIEELKQQKKLPEARAYDLKFRKIEMIYGSRLIEITSVADEVRAAKFAVALQCGYEFAGRIKANTPQNIMTTTTPAGDNLPE